MTIYAGVIESGEMVVWNDLEFEPIGPYLYVQVASFPNFSQRPTPTSRPFWIDGRMEWVERAGLMLIECRAKSSEEVDALSDAARESIAHDGLRGIEYLRTEELARSYAAGGYSGAAPLCVLSWANAKQWAVQVATDDILAAADRWYAALDGIRDLRLNAKQNMVRATTIADLANLLATFKSNLTAAMQGVE